MNNLYFVIGLLVYCYMYYLWVRMYFWVANFVRLHFYKIISFVLLMVWLCLFGVIQVVMLFFPAWLSEKLDFMERTPTTTGTLILLGCVVAGVAVWRAWLSKEGREFRNIIERIDI